MSPARPVVNLRSRDWRIQLKAALDALNSDPIKPSINDTLARLK